MSALPEERQETALERAQRRRDEALARPIVIRCQDCLWEQEGPVLEARRAWAEHRRDEHDDPSGMESVERIAKPLTMREIKHGGRKTKHSPRCKQDGCSVTAVHTSGLCHEHELRRTHERKERSAMPHRTCEEVAGCTNQTVSDRGVYARVCAEHKDLVTQRRRQAGLGLVPEGRQIFPNLTVRENLVATARPGDWDLSRVFELFPNLREREKHFGNQLSGGEQQMLAIGRALMTNPKLLILDEATEGLAPRIRAEIYRSIARLKETGLSILVIDKDVKALIRVADVHYMLEKGRVVWTGSSAELAASVDVQHRYLGV